LNPVAQIGRVYRPPFIRSISAIAPGKPGELLYLDEAVGCISRLSLESGQTIGVLNRSCWRELRDATSFLTDGEEIWYGLQGEIHAFSISDNARKKRRIRVDGLTDIVGLSRVGTRVCAACRDGLVAILDTELNPISTFRIGATLDSACMHRDDGEEVLACLDSSNRRIIFVSLDGMQRFALAVPHEGATAIASVPPTGSSATKGNGALYVAYVRNTWEVVDDIFEEAGNEPNIVLKRNTLHALIERLTYRKERLEGNGTLSLSSGYRVEMEVIHRLHPPREMLKELAQLRANVWLSIPRTSSRQRIVCFEPIGDLPFSMGKDLHGEPTVEFDLSRVRLDEEMVSLGFRVVLDLFNARWFFPPMNFPTSLPEEVRHHLREEKRLDMHRPEMKKIVDRILADLDTSRRNDLFAVARAIREYVYERLDYRHTGRETSPLQTLDDGEGTCGKYTDVLLALLKLAGIPCRQVGDYKVPEYKLEYGPVGQEAKPDYDHVWIEFWIPGAGWIPMESSSDDLPGKHDRFLAALPWINVEFSRTEVSKDIIDIETGESAVSNDLNFRDLFERETRFRILEELEP